MGKYGSGLTMGQICNMEKERIKEALNGRLAIGEDENGFIYGEAPREECEAAILATFDAVVHQLMQAMASARAHERIMRDRGVEITLPEYRAAMEAESARYNDYRYEYEEDEDDD